MLNTELFTSLREVFNYGLNGLESGEDLRVLGETNLRVLISRLRSEEKSSTHYIETLFERRAFFEGKSGKDFTELASQFERPVVKMSITPMSWGKPEPIDAESLGRERGTTTFNICGWCKHATSGLARYGYMIESTCALTPNGKVDGEYEEHHADSPCKFLSFTTEQCQQEAKNWLEEIEKVKARREKVRTLIMALQAVAKGQPQRPLLPEMRPFDYFNVGEVVGVLTQDMPNLIIEESWVTAKVIPGYRHHDGCVSFVADFPFHSGDYLQGMGGGAGCSSACILKEWELQALKTAVASQDPADHRFVDIFVRAASNSQNLQSSEYRKALESGAIATAQRA